MILESVPVPGDHRQFRHGREGQLCAEFDRCRWGTAVNERLVCVLLELSK